MRLVLLLVVGVHIEECTYTFFSTLLGQTGLVYDVGDTNVFQEFFVVRCYGALGHSIYVRFFLSPFFSA